MGRDSLERPWGNALLEDQKSGAGGMMLGPREWVGLYMPSQEEPIPGRGNSTDAKRALGPRADSGGPTENKYLGD